MAKNVAADSSTWAYFFYLKLTSGNTGVRLRLLSSGGIRNQVPFLGESHPPVPSNELNRLFWRSWQSWHFLYKLDTAFLSTITLLGKKVSEFHVSQTSVSGIGDPPTLLVTLTEVSTFWNQVSLFTLSKPLRILNVCNMSVCLAALLQCC